MIRVADLMTKQVSCCRATDTLEQAAQLMWTHDCGSLPVCEGGNNGSLRPIGMITDRDVCMHALFAHKPLSDLRVADAMGNRLLSCGPGDGIDRAEEIMRTGQVRRLPVIDDQGQLAGLITLADIAREAIGERGRTSREVSATEVGDTLGAICAPVSAPSAA